MKLSEVAVKFDDLIREVKPQLEDGQRSTYGELMALKIRAKDLQEKWEKASSDLDKVEPSAMLDTQTSELQARVDSLYEELQVADMDVFLVEGSFAAINSMLEKVNEMTKHLHSFMLYEFVQGSNPELDGSKR